MAKQAVELLNMKMHTVRVLPKLQHQTAVVVCYLLVYM